MPPPVTLVPSTKRSTSLKQKSPWKGLNSVDAIAEMSPDYALSCNDFIATPLGLSLREGYYKNQTGYTNPPTTLMVYNSRSGTNQMFSVAGGSIFNATGSGAVGAAVVTGQSAGAPYWQYAQQASQAAVNYLIAMNGVNPPQLYNGSTWTTCTQVSSPSFPGQFGTVDQNGNAVNINSFIDVCLHAQRLWFVSAGSSIAYYIGIQAVGGICQAFDFGAFFPRGGTLKKLISWTIDTGVGVDYNLVAISTKGDIVIYTGNDPTSAVTWSMIGQYKGGSPIGQRCAVEVFGDIWYLSQDGLYPMSQYVQSARIQATASLTYKINPTIQALIALYAGTPGWQMVIYPQQQLLLLNVPQDTGAENIIFCYDIINQAWTTFSPWGANCLALFNDQVYFGGQTFVGYAFQGYTDGASYLGAGGNNIIATALQAFSDIGYQGLKHVKLVKPYLISGQSNPVVTVAINTDFNVNTVPSGGTPTPVTGAIWDVSLWDEATWVGSQAPTSEWFAPSSWPGEYIAVALTLTADSATTWAATNFIIALGQSFG